MNAHIAALHRVHQVSRDQMDAAVVKALAVLGAPEEWDMGTVEWVYDALQPIAKAAGLPDPNEWRNAAAWRAVALDGNICTREELGIPSDEELNEQEERAA